MYYILGIIAAVIIMSVIGAILSGIASFAEAAPRLFKLLLVIGVIAVFWGPAEKWYRDYQKEQYMKVEIPRFSRSEEALNGCIKAFKEEPFLAPAWKRNLPDAAKANTNVDVYRHLDHNDYANYIFVIPETLKSNWNFWLESEVPEYTFFYAKPRILKAVRVAHFQKGDFLGFFKGYNSVACNPTVSGVKLGSMEKYYLRIEGGFSNAKAKKYMEVRDKDTSKADRLFKYVIEKKGMGMPFRKESLTSDSVGMEKVYSIKL